MGIGANITARARHIFFQIFGASIYIFLHRYRVRRRPQTGLPVHPCGPELAGSCAVVLRAFFRLSLFFHLVTLGRRQRKMERERKRRKRRGVVGRGLYIRDISRGIVSVVVVRLLNDFLHHRYYFLDETRALLALGFILNFPCVVLGCDRGLSWLVYRFGIVNDSEDRGPKWFVGCYEA